jgi:hypothetical protein
VIVHVCWVAHNQPCNQYGGRAEWEGFTAIVNKALTAKFETMVKRAPELIKTLPWGKDFEVGRIINLA